MRLNRYKNWARSQLNQPPSAPHLDGTLPVGYLDRAKKSLSLLLGLMLWVAVAPAHAAIVTWDGGGADNNWNTCANWSPADTCPTNADIATFNATSIKDVSITADPDVEGIDIQAGYTGIITQNPGVAITIGISNYIQADGTFVGGDAAFLTAGLILNGGTFTATSGIMTIDDDFIFTAGTFNHGTGTITFTGGGSAAFTFDVVPTLNHVIFNRTNRIDISGLSPTLDINGNFTMSNSTDIDGGVISMAGNITTTDTAVTGNSAFTVDGNNVQTIDGSGISAALPNLTINKSGGSLTFLNDISFNQNFTYTAGVVDTTTNNVTIQFGLTGSNSTSTINSGTMQFNHVILNKTNHFYVDGTMDINGDLTINSARSLRDTLATDKITLAGNLVSNDATIVGGLEIEFDGTTDQTINTGSNDLSNGLLRVNKTSGVLRLLADLTLSLNGNTTADLTVTQGTLDLNSFNLTVSDVLTVGATGIFQLQGNESVLSTTQTLAAGSTVIYDGAVVVNGLVMGNSYHHLIFNNATTGHWTLDAPLSVNGNLTITDGMLDTNGASNFSVNVTGDYAQTGGQMIANGSTITVGGNFTGDVTDDDAGYNSASVVLTGTGSLALNNLTTFWGNGFNNLTVGQSSNTTTFDQMLTVRNVLTVGSGEITTTGTGRIHLLGAGDVLAVGATSTISLQALKFQGNSVTQNLPTLNNGYDTDIALSGLNTTVTQTGNVTLNGTNSLRIFGDTIVDRTNTYNTGGFDLNVGGNIEIGAGNDTALKRLNAGSSAITVGGNFTIADIGTGSVQADFIPGTSSVTLNGPATQSITLRGSSFNNLIVTNVSGIVTFSDALTTANLTAITPSTQLEFTDSITHTVSGTLNLNGQAALSEVILTSTSPGVQFSLDVGATNPQVVNYVSVRDSNVLGSNITAFNSVNATGNDNIPLATPPQWVFLNTVTISGFAYANDDDTGPIGAATVRLMIDGSDAQTLSTTTDGFGAYSISANIAAGQTLLGYLDTGGVTVGNTVTVSDATALVNFNIYQNRLTVRNDNGGSTTNIDLGNAHFSDAGDVIYAVDGSNNLTANGTGIELFIPTGHTFAPSATVNAHDIDINGVFNPITNTINVSGSWDATGGSLSSTGTTTFTSVDTGETVTTNAQTFGPLIFDSADATGGWILQDAFTSTSISVIDGNLADNGQTLTINGNINISAANNIVTSTGTWTQAANGTLVSNNSFSSNRLNVLHIADNVTSTRVGEFYVERLVLGIDAALAGPYPLWIYPNGDDFIDMAIGATISDGSIQINSSGNFSQKAMTIGETVALSFSNSASTIQMTGDWNLGGSNLWIHGWNVTTEADAKTLDTNGYNLTVSGDLLLGHANTGTTNAGRGKIFFRNGTHTIGGNMRIHQGANGTIGYIDMGAANISIAGDVDFTDAIVTPSTSTVTLNGNATQTITSASQLFNNLAITNASNTIAFADALTTVNLTAITPNAQLIFADTITHTVSGTLNLNGQATSTEVVLTSTTPGNQFSLDVGVTNPQTVNYVSVRDSNALGSDITALDSINGSGNDDTPPASPPQWVFSSTAPFTWTNNNGAGDNNWNTPTNWSGGVVPSVSDIAIFNGTYDYPATINISPNVAGIQIAGGYSSTITQQNGTDLTVGASGYSQSSGTFIGGDATSTVDLNGAMVINGGTYIATAGSTTLANDLTISGSALFNRNSGTFTFDTPTTRTIDVGSAIFNNVTLNQSGGNFNVSGTMDVDGTFTIIAVNSINSGTIAVSGDVITQDSGVGGDGLLLIDGINQTLRRDGLGGIGAIPGIEINNTGTLTIDDVIQLDGTSGWTFTSGAVDAMSLGSTIVFDGANSTFITDSTTQFNNVELSFNGASLTVNSTINVDGMFTISSVNNIETGTIMLSGDLMTTDANVGGTGMFLFDGINQELYSDKAGATGAIPGIEINNTGTLTIFDNIQIEGSTGWTLTAGNVDATTQNSKIDFIAPTSKTINDTSTIFNDVEVDMVGGTLTVTGSMNIDGDFSLTGANSVNGGLLTVAGDLTLSDASVGGTASITLDGGNAQTINSGGTGDLPNGTFTIAKSANIATLASDLVLDVVGQDLLVSSGTLDLSGFNLTLTASGDVLTVASGATLQLQGDETVIASTVDLQSGSTVVYNGALGPYNINNWNYQNLTFNGSGSWNQVSSMDINGDLTISSGTLNSVGQDINLAGNWTNNATYNSGANLVTLDGNGQIISGSSSFNNLTKITAASTLTIQDGTTQSIAGLAILQGGGTGTELALRSTTPGTRASISFNGTTSFNFLDVRDSDASPSSITTPLSPANSVNSGNNVGWFTATTNAVTSVVAEITPNSAVVSTTSNAFVFYILPTITGSDSGFNQSIITAPAGYSNLSIATVAVNSTPLTAGASCPTLSAGEYCAVIAGQNMTLNFGTAITTNQTPIQVNFTADAPNTIGSNSFIFTVDDTNTPNAPQVGVAGDADSTPTNSNSLDVNITPPGNAVTSIIAEVTPSTAGNNTAATPFSLHLLPTISPSDSGFNRTTITLPSGYANFNVTSAIVDGAPLIAGTLCPTISAGEYCSSIAGQIITIDFGTPIATSLSTTRIDFTSDTPSTTGTAAIAYSIDDTSTGSVPPQSGLAGDADSNPTNSNNLNITLVAVDATLSTVTIDPEMIIADGIATGTVTVTLRNSNGQPVSGKSIQISTDRGAADTIVQPIGVTNANGVAQGTISSSTLGTTTLTITNTTDGITLTSTPQAHFTQGQVLTLTKSANKTNVVVGDLVTYTIEVRNATNNAVQQVRIEDLTPDNFKYRSGSTLLNNVPAADPSGNRTRTFNLGTVPALIDSNGNGEADPGEIGYVKYSYQLIVGSGALPGSYINTAIAKDVCDTCTISNSSTAEVNVALDPLFDLGTIIGKVFHDKNRDGWQDQNEEGIAGAMVVLDEGTYALTDSHGRYHFPAVTPGERLLKINLTTLPSGTTLSDSETQVVSVTPGLLVKANFGAIQNLVIKKIGHPGIRGVVININEEPKKTVLTGSTELQTIIVNGSQVRLPSAEVRMNVNGIPSEVLDFSGKKLVHPARFYTDVSQPEEIKSWELNIMTPEGETVMNFEGSRAPPEIIEWNGYDNSKNQLTGGSLYHYQLTINYTNGDYATSARRLIGIDQRSVIELNLSGGSFKAGNFSLSKSAMKMLKDAAATLRRFPREQVVIEGHADSSGGQQANLDLSQKRAEAAHAYLVGVEGISPMRLKLRWYGEEKPIANNDSTEGRLLNRRIAMKGLVSDITRANRRSRFFSRDIASINGETLAIDRFGRFSVPIEENKTLLIELSNKHGRSISARLSVPQLLVIQPKNGALIPHDSSESMDSTLSASSSNNASQRYQLVGKTEPGSLIQIGSTKVATSDDGTFEYPLTLELGEQSLQLVIYDPQGFTYITELNMDVLSHNDLNKPIYLQDPIPELQLDLPPTGFTLKEGSYTLSGHTSPDNVVLINNKVISVEPDGRFTHTLALKQGKNPVHVKTIDPRGYVGTIEHTIGAGESELFFMAFADGKFSQLNTKGYIQGSGQKSASEFYSEGRLAFYLKGKILGKYLITAALDTGQNEIGALFKDLDDDGSKALLSNLDPDYYYPVYGDNSTLVYDAQSQGKFYLAVNSDTINGVVGNYKLNLTDNELAAYRRTLYGGLFEYQSLSRTKYGQQKTVVRLFGAQTRQSYARDELRATGGSLYYMSQRDIIEGSEQVSIIVKDKNTGLTLSRQPQQQNIDYSIKYLGGRILFTRPISSTQQDDNIINDALLAGNPVYIEVDYEYYVAAFEKSASGVHARQQLGDRVAIGATYVDDKLAAGRYELQGIDGEIRIMENSRIIAEIAESSGSEGATFTSDDGGLTYAPISTGQQTGQATKIAAEIDLGEFSGNPDRLIAGAYIKDLEPGFQARGNSSDQGKQKRGADITIRVTDKNTLKLKHDQEKSTAVSSSGGIESSQQSTAQWQYKAEKWSLTGEYNDQQSEGSSGMPLNQNSLAAAKLTGSVTEKLEASISHQTTLEGTANDQSTLGLKYDLTEHLHLQGSATSGDRGEAGEARIGYRSDKISLYLAERLNDNQSGRSTSTIIGGETSTATIAGAESGKVYSEYQWDNNTQGDKSLSLVGAEQQWKIDHGWKFNLSSEYSDINTLSGTTSRTTVAIGMSYMRKGLKISTRNEIRNDRGNARKKQLLTSNTIEYNLNPDYIVLGKYRYSVTQNLTTGSNDARFDEQSIGLAYRPTRNDRLNALARLTRLSDMSPLSLDTAIATTTQMDVLSIEWSYQITKKLEWSAKQAIRLKTEQSAGYAEFETQTHLSLNRLNYALPRQLYLGAEYRTLTQKETNDQRAGWLSELAWEAKRHLRLGIGYNFTDFSDNEFSANDYSTAGWFIRIQGKY